MPRPRKPMPWIPLDVAKWLDGSTREELDHDERAIWIDMLCLAARHRGLIGANPDDALPYSLSRLAGILYAEEELVKRTIDKCIRIGKLERLDSGLLKVIKWDKYQLSDSYRRSLQAETADDKRKPMTHKRFPSNDSKKEKDNKKENKKEKEGRSEVKNTPDSIFDYRMTIRLRRHVESYKGTKPKTKAELKKWVDVFGFMRKRDNLDPCNIRRWLLWAIGDEFWRGNILSASKFRQRVQEGKIQAAMARSNKGKKPSEDWQERDRIAAQRSKAQMRKLDEEAETAKREADQLAEQRITDPVGWAKCVLVEQDITEAGLQKLLKSQFTLGFHREAVQILLQELTKQPTSKEA